MLQLPVFGTLHCASLHLEVNGANYLIPVDGCWRAILMSKTRRSRSTV
jgi:hypothetical protein